MRESVIEKTLCDRVKVLGGQCEKFASLNKRSVPDRLVTLPGGIIIFVEVKAPGERPTRLQQRDHAKRRLLGCDVRVIDNREDANAFTP